MKYVKTFEGFLNETSNKVNESLSVRDNGIRDGVLYVDINGHEYGYGEIKGGADLSEIARKFRKMLQFSSGRALAWLKNNTDLVAGSKKNEAEDIKAAIGSMVFEAKSLKPGKITEDEDGEMVKLTTESGFVELGNIFDEDGAMQDVVSIYAKDNSPQGYTAVKISDLQKLIQAYNKAEWAAGKI